MLEPVRSREWLALMQHSPFGNALQDCRNVGVRNIGGFHAKPASDEPLQSLNLLLRAKVVQAATVGDEDW